MPMLKNLLALILVFALALLVVQPGVRAQTRLAETTPDSLPGSQAKTKAKTQTDLKAYFDSELRTMKNRSLTSADLVRIEKNSQTPKPKSASSLTNKEKVFLALFIVCLTGLVIYAIKHPCKEKKPGDCEFVDDTTF